MLGFILISLLLDILLKEEILSWSLMEVKSLTIRRIANFELSDQQLLILLLESGSMQD